MKNLGLKVLALLIACVLWFVVSAPRREQIVERIVTASISVVGVPSRLVITTDIPGTVGVRVRGRLSDLKALASQNLEASVDLSKIEAGEAEITLRAHSINVPATIEVVSIFPNKIRFRIEPLRQRAVDIRPFLVGNPPVGYSIGQPTSEPARALISGPSSQILKLSEVTTERIIMTGRTATFVQNVAVVADSPLVRVVSPVTTEVTVPVLAEVGPSPPAGSTDTTATTDTAERKPE
jgi:YbbR domain-containing protein